MKEERKRFFEKKNKKSLYSFGAESKGCQPPRERMKVFLLLFLQKKKTLPLP